MKTGALGGLPVGIFAIGGLPLGICAGGLPCGTTGVGGTGKLGIDCANADAISSADTPPLAADSSPTTDSITAFIRLPSSIESWAPGAIKTSFS